MVLERDQWSVKLHSGTNDLRIKNGELENNRSDSSCCNGDILKTKQSNDRNKEVGGKCVIFRPKEEKSRNNIAKLQQQIWKQTIEISVWTQERNSTNLNDFLSLVEHKRWHFDKYLKVFCPYNESQW